MKLSIIIIGIAVGILGVLSVWSAGSWTMWWGIVSIPSPLAFFRPLNPYAHYILSLIHI